MAHRVLWRLAMKTWAPVLTLSSFLIVACGGEPSGDPPIVLPDGALPDAGLDAQVEPDAGPPVSLMVVPTGSMNVARFAHTATALPNGRVIFIGGEDLTRVANASIEEYDPETGTFTEVATLPAPRSNHTTTLLPDGRLLVVGGGISASNGIPSGNGVTDSVVIFDPATRDVTEAAPLGTARGHHGAVALPDGRVLVAGGAGEAASGFTPLGAVEIFDPEEGTWSAGGTLAQPRAMLSLAMHDGAVLVIGGFTPSGSPVELERIDPATGAVSAAGRLVGPGRFFHSTLRREDGSVLVAGGIAAPVFLDIVEQIDASGDAFTALPVLPSPRNSFPMVETPYGVIAVGGFIFSPMGGGRSLEEIFVLDDATQRFELAGTLPFSGRSASTATLLPSGDVLVAGGYTTFGVLEDAVLVRAE